MYHAIADAAVSDHGAQHNRAELAILLAVVHQVIQPRLMVEIGSWRGGSLYAWSRLGIEVVAVTLPDRAAEPFRSHGARMVWGNSHDSGVQAQLLAALGGRPVDLVYLDGDHTEIGTNQDLELAARLAPGGVIAVHDINLHRRYPGIGVRRAWDAAAAQRPHMVIEASPDTAPGVGLLFPGPGELPGQFTGPRAGITARGPFMRGVNYARGVIRAGPGVIRGAGIGLYTVPLYACCRVVTT